jgi:hypothetical protein
MPTETTFLCTVPGCSDPATCRVVSTDPVYHPSRWEVVGGGDGAVRPCSERSVCHRTGRCQDWCAKWRYVQAEFCPAHAQEVAASRRARVQPWHAASEHADVTPPAPRTHTRRKEARHAD